MFSKRNTLTAKETQNVKHILSVWVRRGFSLNFCSSWNYSISANFGKEFDWDSVLLCEIQDIVTVKRFNFTLKPGFKTPFFSGILVCVCILYNEYFQIKIDCALLAQYPWSKISVFLCGANAHVSLLFTNVCWKGLYSLHSGACRFNIYTIHENRSTATTIIAATTTTTIATSAAVEANTRTMTTAKDDSKKGTHRIYTHRTIQKSVWTHTNFVQLLPINTRIQYFIYSKSVVSPIWNCWTDVSVCAWYSSLCSSSVFFSFFLLVFFFFICIVLNGRSHRHRQSDMLSASKWIP